MNRRTTHPRFFTIAAAAMLLGCPIARGADAPADPQFCCATDSRISIFGRLLLAQFTPTAPIHVGDPAITLNFSVLNQPAPTGTTSPMTLINTVPFGDTIDITLNTGTIVGLPPGGQAPMSLTLSTSNPSPPGRQTETSFTLTFKSDSLDASAPKPQVSIAAYATILRRGDYDADGDVDNADYGIWRANFGSTNTAADGNQNGVVDAADYVVWQNNYTGPLSAAASLASGSALDFSATVPEPGALLLALFGLSSLGLNFRQRTRRPR